MTEIGNNSPNPEVSLNPMGERARYLNRLCLLMAVVTTDELKMALGQQLDETPICYSTFKEVLI